MAVVVTVRWLTPPPSSIDERLVVSDDGQARLEVFRPRVPSDTVGTFQGAVDGVELRELSATGRRVELGVVVADPALAAVAFVADRVADRLRSSPRAAAQFFARPVGGAPVGMVTLALGVIGRGSEPVEFELDVEACAVHFSAAGAPVSWSPFPELPIGFMTADAEGLGGVRQRATVAPGTLGAISVQLPMPEEANEVSVQLVGRWYRTGEPMPEAFEVRTDPASG